MAWIPNGTTEPSKSQMCFYQCIREEMSEILAALLVCTIEHAHAVSNLERPGLCLLHLEETRSEHAPCTKEGRGCERVDA